MTRKTKCFQNHNNILIFNDINTIATIFISMLETLLLLNMQEENHTIYKLLKLIIFTIRSIVEHIKKNLHCTTSEVLWYLHHFPLHLFKNQNVKTSHIYIYENICINIYIYIHIFWEPSFIQYKLGRKKRRCRIFFSQYF